MRQLEDYTKIIYWSGSGEEFMIRDVDKFEEIVLPRYFRHNKMNSFVRQLNMYGFHKIKHNHFKSTFRHPHFRRAHPYPSQHPVNSSPSSGGSPNPRTSQQHTVPIRMSPPRNSHPNP